jgi:hypothetical protein
LTYWIFKFRGDPRKIRKVFTRVAFLGRSTTYQNASQSLEKYQDSFNRKA